MAAIAGIALPNAEIQLREMLDRMAHRSPKGRLVKTHQDVTLGVGWTEAQSEAQKSLQKSGIVEDAVCDSQFARTADAGKTCVRSRDRLGTAPLYYGFTSSGALCFSSEVKGLLNLVGQVHELPPGCTYEDGKVIPRSSLAIKKPVEGEPVTIASEIRKRLKQSVERLANRSLPSGV